MPAGRRGAAQPPTPTPPPPAGSTPRKAPAAPKAPAIFRAGTLSSAPPGPTAGSGGKSPTNRNALPPPASPPSPSHPPPLPSAPHDRAAQRPHPGGIAPARRRPARDTASSHHSIYSAGAAVTISVTSFPPAAPGSRRQPNPRREEEKGKQPPSSTS